MELEERFVVGYSGNLGRAHEFRTILAAAEQLRDQSHILFLMIGGGKGFDELSREVANRQLQNLFRFMPYQDRAHLKYSLSAPDIHWLSLRPEVEGLIVPSKFYGITAAGRPTVVIGARDGEIARLVREHGCGLVVARDDASTLVRSLSTLSSDHGAVQLMGLRAREMLEARFSRQQALERWRHLLSTLDHGGKK